MVEDFHRLKGERRLFQAQVSYLWGMDGAIRPTILRVLTRKVQTDW